MKIDSILLFESPYVRSLYPFSIMHCSWEVRCGAFRMFEKVQKQFPSARILFTGREKHLKSFLARFEHDSQDIRKENMLILNSSVLPTDAFWDSIHESYKKFSKEKGTDKSVAFCYQSVPVAVFLPAEEMINPINFDAEFLPKLLSDYSNILPKAEITEPKLINFLWDAIEFNSQAIEDDKRFFVFNVNIHKFIKSGVHAINEERIFIGSDVTIHPGVLLDASAGSIIIGNNVTIMGGSNIAGPCFIGDNSIIKFGAKIYKDCSFGEFCKIGGEIENSIIQSFSNKQHDGFLGHSYISEWVNLGADTNTSDLKNTYSNINVRIKGERFNTGRMFLGLLCGDHTKTAIMTRFTTGTIAGISGVLFHDDFLPSYIPSFCYGGAKDSKSYGLEKAIETAKIVMKRRGKDLTSEEIELFSDEFKDLA